MVRERPRRKVRWILQQRRAERPDSIGWQNVPGRSDRWQPVVFTDGTPAAPLNPWWAGDRFAWDKAVSVAALDGTQVVVVSAAGPWVGTMEKGFSIGQFWNRPDIVRAAAGRRGGLCFGVALRSTSGPTLAVRPAPDGHAARAPQTIAPLEESRLRWQHLSASDDAELSFAHLAFVQHWEPETWDRGGGAALESAVADSPAEELIRDGSFIFDHATGACPLTGNGHWLAWRNDGGVSRLAHNVTFPSARKGRTRLVLTYDWRETFPIRELRSIDAGRVVLALYGADDAPKFASAPAGDERLAWKDSADPEIVHAFQIGEQVSVDVSTFSWTVDPLYPWSNASALAQPFVAWYPGLHSYSPFQATGNGLAFAFDDCGRSIATRETPSGRQIAADLAGVWIGPRGAKFCGHIQQFRRAIFLRPERRYSSSYTRCRASRTLRASRRLDRNDHRGDTSAALDAKHKPESLVETRRGAKIIRTREPRR